MENFKAQKDNLRCWNKTAKNCYEIGANCFICDFVPQRFKYLCKVKYYVPELIKKFGIPKKRG